MKVAENFGDEQSRLGPVEREVRRKRPRWGKTALITELECLALTMRKIAERMQEHEGEIKEHGEELERAAKTAKTWAKGIKEQLDA